MNIEREISRVIDYFKEQSFAPVGIERYYGHKAGRESLVTCNYCEYPVAKVDELHYSDGIWVEKQVPLNIDCDQKHYITLSESREIQKFYSRQKERNNNESERF